MKVKKIAGLSILLMLIGAPLSAQISASQETVKQTTEIPDADLQKFTEAYQEIQLENQKAQQVMIGVIEKEGLDVKRFSEIQRASMDPNSTVVVSAEEQAKHDKADAKLKEMQEGFQQKMNSIIEGKGLSLERFDQIFVAVQNSTALQQKVQDMLQK